MLPHSFAFAKQFWIAKPPWRSNNSKWGHLAVIAHTQSHNKKSEAHTTNETDAPFSFTCNISERNRPCRAARSH